MVDETLKAHLLGKLTTKVTENTETGKNQNPSHSDPSSSVLSVPSVVKNSSPSVVRSKLYDLFADTEKERAHTPAGIVACSTAIDALKMLDPAFKKIRTRGRWKTVNSQVSG